ncbi:MAG: hypothetical protein ACRYF5_18935, partial [Janthinobacterium lividum]
MLHRYRVASLIIIETVASRGLLRCGQPTPQPGFKETKIEAVKANRMGITTTHGNPATMIAPMVHFSRSVASSHQSRGQSHAATSTAGETAKPAELSGKKFKELRYKISYDAQVALFETLGNFIFHFQKNPANVAHASDMLKYLTGKKDVRLPAGLQALEVDRNLAKQLSSLLDSKLSLHKLTFQSLKNGDCKARLEALFIECLAGYPPSHSRWFEKIFYPQDKESIFQPEKIVLPTLLQQKITVFKQQVLEELRCGSADSENRLAALRQNL